MRSIGRSWAAAAILAVVAACSAGAADAPAIVQVTATVNSACRVTAAGIAFGSYDPLGIHQAAPLEAETRLFVACTRAIAGTITLQPAHGTVTSAFLVSGSDQLAYALFEDPARATLWRGYSTSGRRRTFDVPVYGRIFAAQDVPSGDYADTITARLDF